MGRKKRVAYYRVSTKQQGESGLLGGVRPSFKLT